MKEHFATFTLFCFLFLPALADDNSNQYVGYPKGFYEDIDPNTLEQDDEEPVNNNKNKIQDEAYKTIYNDNELYEQPLEVKSTKNYAQIYNNLEPADFSYQHDIDPDQYYDMKDTAWSVYPLLRLNSDIYFKQITIEPGYYLLTPREHNGKWYMLFKQNGVVKHIIPVYNRDYTPESFYDEHIPKPKLTKAQKVHMGFLNLAGKVKSSKRKEPVKSFLEVNDVDNYFVSIIIYYGGHKYYTIFRTIRL